MRVKVATWNINSVRLRIGLVCRLLKEHGPDILCLQETKCPQGQFPSSPLKDLGYSHVAESGQAGYHGVAIARQMPDDRKDDDCADEVVAGINGSARRPAAACRFPRKGVADFGAEAAECQDHKQGVYCIKQVGDPLEHPFDRLVAEGHNGDDGQGERRSTPQLR